MGKIYIDSGFCCHATDGEGTLRTFGVEFFEGKCDTFIEGYRFIPAGESWTREDGKVFQGEMIAPWKEYAELDAAQREYERRQLAEYEATVGELIGGVNDVQYE